MRFAQAEPETVNLYLDNQEQELLQQGYGFGERYKHEWLLEKKPAWALARSWAVNGGARDHLREELACLQELSREAIAALRAAGEAHTADRLQRATRDK